MYGTRAGPSGRGTAQQPLAGRRASRVGFVRYVPLSRPSGQEARRDAVKARCARNHFLRVARFMELACTGIDAFRQELNIFTDELEKHRAVRSGTRNRVVRLEKALRGKTLEYVKSVQTLASRMEASQIEVSLVLEGSESDLGSDEDYERTEEVFVTVPERRHATSQRLVRNISRVRTWLRQGSRRQPDTSRTDETSPLRTKSLKTLDEEQRSTSEGEEEQPSGGDQVETLAGAQSLAEGASGVCYRNSEGEVSDVGRDEGSNGNEDGHGNETAEAVDVELEESTQDGVLREVCRQCGSVRRLLLLHAMVLHAKMNERWEMARQVDERRMTRLMVAHQMNTVTGLMAELREALLLLAGHALALRQLGAEAWPAEPQLPPSLVGRHGCADPQRPARRGRSASWRVCSLLCCIRGRQ